MIDVKLTTEEDLIITKHVTFSEEAELVNSDDIISKAQVIIPSSIILHQFEIEGIPTYTQSNNLFKYLVNFPIFCHWKIISYIWYIIYCF